MAWQMKWKRIRIERYESFHIVPAREGIVLMLTPLVRTGDADHQAEKIRPRYHDSSSGPDVLESACLTQGASGLHGTTEGSNTHKTETREVRYAWHPWYGRQVIVRGIRNRSGAITLLCTMDDEHEFP